MRRMMNFGTNAGSTHAGPASVRRMTRGGYRGNARTHTHGESGSPFVADREQCNALGGTFKRKQAPQQGRRTEPRQTPRRARDVFQKHREEPRAQPRGRHDGEVVRRTSGLQRGLSASTHKPTRKALPCATGNADELAPGDRAGQSGVRGDPTIPSPLGSVYRWGAPLKFFRFVGPGSIGPESPPLSSLTRLSYSLTKRDAMNASILSLRDAACSARSRHCSRRDTATCSTCFRFIEGLRNEQKGHRGKWRALTRPRNAFPRSRSAREAHGGSPATIDPLAALKRRISEGLSR